MATENSRIQDLPSFKKLLGDIYAMQQVRRAFPVLRPVLRLLGVRVEQIDALLKELDALEASARTLASLPDRFNSVFAARGWIAYGSLNADLMQEAITKAEAGDVEGAEQLLVDHYDEQTVRRQLMTMHVVKSFRPRLELAQKALTDYAEGRYHACVPVTLAPLDGMVNALGPRGFFAEGVNLEAWDSVAAHNTGLAELARLLGRRRTATTTEPIAVPYRNGILHGMDLGYDNKAVAAKAWAALLAAREWAQKVEQGVVTEPPPEPKATWREILGQMRENADDRRRLEAWEPRRLRHGEDLSPTGGPELYAEGTPERKLVEFLTCWRACNYGGMARCLPFSLYGRDYTPGKLAGRMRTDYGAKRLTSFTLLEVTDEAPAVTVIKTNVVYDEGGQQHEQVTDVRLLYEDETGRPLVWGKPEGAWSVVTYPA